jgi:hypothetical protein
MKYYLIVINFKYCSCACNCAFSDKNTYMYTSTHRQHNAAHNSYCHIHVSTVSRDSVVGIATSYGLDDRGVGVRAPAGSRIFSASSRPVLGPTKLHIQCVPRAPSPGVKRPGREADESPSASAEVEKI